MKKLCLIFISLFLIGINVYSQNLIPNQNNKGKWGYVDDAGSVVIKHNYDDASAFIDGRAKVRKGGKWGYINTSGKEVIPIKYSEMRTWQGNYCKVAEGGKVENGVLTSGGKWGYINRNGDVVLKCEYDEIGSFKDGIAHIKKMNKYGYIDTNYQIFIPVKYSAIGTFNEHGFCWVNDGGQFDKTNTKLIIGGKYGIYNRRGELVIPPKYKKIGTFTTKPSNANPYISKLINTEKYQNEYKKIMKNYRVKGYSIYDSIQALTNSYIEKMSKEDIKIMSECGYFNMLSHTFINSENFSAIEMPLNKCFAVSNDNKIGIINEFGEVLLEPGKYPIAYFVEGNLIPVAKEKNNKLQVNYHNIRTGKLLFKNWFEATGIANFENGVAVIANGDIQYLIDENGNKISSEYDIILPSQENNYIVKRGSYGLIDNLGKEIINPSFNVIYPICEQLMCVQENYNGTFGYMDKTGKYIIPSKYLDAKSFKFGTALVESENGWGEIDKTDKIIINCEWEDIKQRSFDSPKYSWVKKSDLWYSLDISQNKLVSKGYYDVCNFNSDNTIAFIYDENKNIGAVTATDDLIIPFRISSLEVASKCYEYMKENNILKMTDVEAYRYNMMYDDRRNQFRLTEKISDNLWDF